MTRCSGGPPVLTATTTLSKGYKVCLAPWRTRKYAINRPVARGPHLQQRPGAPPADTYAHPAGSPGRRCHRVLLGTTANGLAPGGRTRGVSHDSRTVERGIKHGAPLPRRLTHRRGVFGDLRQNAGNSAGRSGIRRPSPAVCSPPRQAPPTWPGQPGVAARRGCRPPGRREHGRGAARRDTC